MASINKTLYSGSIRYVSYSGSEMPSGYYVYWDALEMFKKTLNEYTYYPFVYCSSTSSPIFLQYGTSYEDFTGIIWIINGNIASNSTFYYGNLHRNKITKLTDTPISFINFGSGPVSSSSGAIIGNPLPNQIITRDDARKLNNEYPDSTIDEPKRLVTRHFAKNGINLNVNEGNHSMQDVKFSDLNSNEHDYLCFHVINTCTIGYTNYGGNNPNIQYSTDKVNWTTFPASKQYTAGTKIYLKGVNTSGFNTLDSKYTKFNIGDKTIVSGNIMSLIDGLQDGVKIIPNDYCFYALFSSTEIISASNLELPATTLKSYCYYRLFSSCPSLISGPELPATTLASECYAEMFSACTSLVNAPELPATTLVGRCYAYMFNGCTNLNYIKCSAPYDSTGAFYNWLNGVSSSGSIIVPSPSSWPDGNSGIPNSWSVFNYDNITATDRFKFLVPRNTTVTFKMVKTGSYTTPTYRYSINNKAPRSVTLGSNISVSGGTNGAYIWFDGYNDTSLLPPSISSSNFIQFQISGGKVCCFGKVTDLIAYDSTIDISNKSYCFYKLFNNCTSLVTAPELPATTLANSCYYAMFFGCTSLVTAPELPATTLTNSCYLGMFNSCTSLTRAPELPATTLADGCYWSMFYGCTSLIEVPKLPATTLANDCYRSMFSGCSSLVTAPELPATTLSNTCYYYMFSGCSSLVTAPELPNAVLASDCYISMFNGCTSLKKIYCYNLLPSTAYMSSWLNGVSSTGAFVKAKGVEWSVGVSGIPTGWEVEEYG